MNVDPNWKVGDRVRIVKYHGKPWPYHPVGAEGIVRQKRSFPGGLTYLVQPDRRAHFQFWWMENRRDQPDIIVVPDITDEEVIAAKNQLKELLNR